MNFAGHRTDWTSLLNRTEPHDEADYASLRSLGRITVGKSFPLAHGHKHDLGAPTRTVWEIIAESFDAGDSTEAGEPDETDETVMIHESPKGRVQVKARIVRDRGNVSEIRFERSSGHPGSASLKNILRLDEAAARRLIDLCLMLRGIDPTGDETERVDDAILAAVTQDPDAIAAIYGHDPSRFTAMIESDVSARDIVAIAARRRAVDQFERLLTDPDAFEEEKSNVGGRPEAVWQHMFEANPWLLGAGLSGRLFTSWDKDRLERIVAGATITSTGKRVDALLTTTGAVKALVFAELKRHDAPLLSPREYRPGTWAPSETVTGGVAQALMTADRARDDLERWISTHDADGYRTGEEVFTGAPHSYLVVGTLAELARDGQPHDEKVRSFELYRRAVTSPEIITYDEVLARAKWSVAVADAAAKDG